MAFGGFRAYWRRRRSDLILVAVFLLLCAVMLLLPGAPARHAPGREAKVRGRVLKVDNSTVEYRGMLAFGHQQLTVEIRSGEHKGRIFDSANLLTGRTDLDHIFEPGDHVLVGLFESGGELAARTQHLYRLGSTFLLFGLFALLLLAFGGLTGFKALISFVFTCLVIWKLLVPLCLAGYHPVVTAMLVVAVLCAAIIFLVAGINRKGATAFGGAFLGVLASCLMALVFTAVFKIDGAVMPYSQPLFFAGYSHLKLTELFIGAIFLASSGAVMDLAMDVAAGMDEVRRQNPAISRRELMRSGFRIGRMVVGTMTTTLLLAYSGGYLTMIMAFAAEGVSLTDFLNYPYVAAEVVKTVIGSFGLVLVAPFTAIAGSFILRPRRG